ncbi:uncharacterized protein LACBIDRAFT_294573 [Laccaria bicolor S238N-H82]|uniref:Predicted protein n=1 Tax=Laccaria bicolor (strain S238N-H82 / ATCC MYA-4686) TaxID=486041 RepID=B0DE07_LACBS|nr:uncharacterized protein LACBIDRAFT_294573 [Laccaria bicolor S238N-H82]EDR07180.1 predicted protein [Laccaria bicolor S238N-H82]|eukprot:XP_001882111.1 predicted protein [Laccaria bicolor S238N-H82]
MVINSKGEKGFVGTEIYTNKTRNSHISARSFIQILVSVSPKEIIKSCMGHKSHKPGESISHRGPKSTIQAASSRSMALLPATPRQPTPHPNPSQPQHNGTHANAYEYEVTPPSTCGTDCVGLPSHLRAFFTGGWWEHSGWRRNLGWRRERETKTSSRPAHNVLQAHIPSDQVPFLAHQPLAQVPRPSPPSLVPPPLPPFNRHLPLLQLSLPPPNRLLTSPNRLLAIPNIPLHLPNPLLHPLNVYPPARAHVGLALLGRLRVW